MGWTWQCQGSRVILEGFASLDEPVACDSERGIFAESCALRCVYIYLNICIIYIY